MGRSLQAPVLPSPERGSIVRDSLPQPRLVGVLRHHGDGPAHAPSATWANVAPLREEFSHLEGPPEGRRPSCMQGTPGEGGTVVSWGHPTDKAPQNGGLKGAESYCLKVLRPEV